MAETVLVLRPAARRTAEERQQPTKASLDLYLRRHLEGVPVNVS